MPDKLELRTTITFRQELKVVGSKGSNNDWAAYVENDYTRKEGNSLDSIYKHGHKLPYLEAVMVFSDWNETLTWRL